MFPVKFLLSVCIAALPLLAAATPVSIPLLPRQTSGTFECCDETVDPTTLLGINILALLGIPTPQTGLLGISCTDFSAQAVVNGQCTATNIFTCQSSLPLPILSEVISLGCVQLTPTE